MNVRFVVLAFLICSSAVAQEPKRSLEIDSNKAKVKNPNAPRKTKYSVIPTSYAFIRAQHTSLTQGYLSSQVGLNTPGSTYLVGAFGFKSNSATSTSDSDLKSFSTQLYFLSPQFKNFGIAASFISAGTKGSTYHRLGPYFRMLIPGRKFIFSMAPQLYLNRPDAKGGRFFIIWNLNILKSLFNFEGNGAYSWTDTTSSVGIEPAFTFRIFENFRGVISYTYSQSTNKTTNAVTTNQANNLGIEFRSTF